jgi:hypothetical protein
VTPGHGEDEALDFGVGAVQEAVERLLWHVEPVGRGEAGQDGPGRSRLAQPRPERLAA